MLSRRELRLLRAMHTLGTVTAAASSINMTQPAASAMLRDLEIRLGVALFSREKRRLRMTPQGRTLMPEVLNALAALESADRLAQDIRHGTLARLVIGAVAIAASSLLPAALALVRQQHPSVAVTVRAGTALEIIDMAVEHRVDLGIIGRLAVPCHPPPHADAQDSEQHDGHDRPEGPRARKRRFFDLFGHYRPPPRS